MKLIALIEEGRMNNRLSNTEEEMYAKALYTLAGNQRSIYASQTVKALHVVIDLVKTSLNITLKAESKQIEDKPTINQELIQLLQTSTVELSINKTNLRTLTLTAITIEEVKNEEFFTQQKSELYLLFYWYLILYHYGDRTLSTYSSEPQLQETITNQMRKILNCLKNIII